MYSKADELLMDIPESKLNEAGYYTQREVDQLQREKAELVGALKKAAKLISTAELMDCSLYRGDITEINKVLAKHKVGE